MPVTRRDFAKGLFAVAGIPVVGCDCQSSAVCMDKAAAKEIAAHETGVRVAKTVVVKARAVRGGDAEILKFREEAERAFGYPMFVKPSRAGSSVGVTKVKTPEAFLPALKAALAEDSKVLVEEAIRGREVEVAVCLGVTLVSLLTIRVCLVTFFWHGYSPK